MLAFFVWPGRSEGVARRRAASRVLEMCPECVRAFNEQTTLQCLFAGTLSKPSDGLEPSTPPYHEREEGVDSCRVPRSGAGCLHSSVAGHRRVLQTRATLVRPALNRPCVSE